MIITRTSPGKGDIQIRRLFDIDWPQVSCTQHKTRRGCLSSSADTPQRKPKIWTLKFLIRARNLQNSFSRKRRFMIS